MSSSVLLTAAEEDTEIFRNRLEEFPVSVLHYPLERYKPVDDDQSVLDTLQLLDQFENIVHGSKRNARFFVNKLKEYNKVNEASERLNLALNQQTADFLEKEGIPAVHPHTEGKAIDLMEFMLRVRRLGETLYPCGEETAEDLPGFLEELDIPVEELVLFTREGPEETELQKYRQDIAAHEPSFVIFHSRRSVNRILAAFPQLNIEDTKVISGSRAVSEKLETEGVETDIQAEGSWDSILEKLNKIIS